MLVWRPAVDEASGDWPADQLPWVVLQHGNGQSPDVYNHIVSPLVQRGFVVFAPFTQDVFSNIAEVRAAQVLCATRWAHQRWEHRERLSRCLSYVGHSNGGAGTFQAVGLVRSDMPELEIAAVAGMAPGSTSGVFNGAAAFPYLALLGSRDNQTSQTANRLWEQVSKEGDSSPANRVKSVIWAYDVDHNAFGGSFNFSNTNKNEITVAEMSAKGLALATAYIPPFFRWQVLGDLDARARFTGDLLPVGLDVDAWWDYLPQWAGSALIFPTFQNGGRPGVEVQRLRVANFEGNSAGVMSVDPALAATTVVGVQGTLAPTGPSTNTILRTAWDQSAGATGIIAWELAGGSVGFVGSHLSVRAGNVFDGFGSGCTAVASEGPLSFDVALETTDGARVRIRVPDLVVQDHGLVPGANNCASEQVLPTYRIPLPCFVPEDPGPFDPAAIDRIELHLGADPNHPAGTLLFDSIEITASEEEPGGPPNCSRFEAP